tara:strand:- start:574 stop:1137 length:564 start_codon:yes stop_codon:yes gene_type:complete
MKFKIIKFKSVQSTNNEAIKLINKNKNNPTLILTENQTRGRGTRGKKWISKKGNLFFSIYFEFNETRINFKQFAVLNALILRKILTKYVSKKINIKWPNDLLIEKKKVCGILQEVVKYNHKNFLIIGTGINTNYSPKIINLKTSCLKDFSKKKLDNKEIIMDIKKTYEKFIEDMYKNKFSFLKKNLK